MDENRSYDENEGIEAAPKFDDDADIVGFEQQQGAQRTPLPSVGNPYNQNHEDVEFSQELTANEFSQPVAYKSSEKAEVDAKTGFGWFALVLSIVSFFMMPIFLSGAGIILGFVAKSRGADTLGNTAIIAGAISMIITLFIVPMV